MRDGCSLFVAYTVYVFHVVSIASKEETWLYKVCISFLQLNTVYVHRFSRTATTTILTLLNFAHMHFAKHSN